MHGRTREQKGQHAGSPSWRQIEQVVNSVQIPIIANGGVQSPADIESCLHSTGAAGVMVAEANLHNPCMFHGIYKPVWEVVDEYLDICQQLEQFDESTGGVVGSGGGGVGVGATSNDYQYSNCSGRSSSSSSRQRRRRTRRSSNIGTALEPSVNAIRGHIFKLCEPAFQHHAIFRQRFFHNSHTLEEICVFMKEFKALLRREAAEAMDLGTAAAAAAAAAAEDTQLHHNVQGRDRLLWLQPMQCQTVEEIDKLPYWYCKTYPIP